MNERFYLLFVGLYILCALYLEVDVMIYILSCLLLFEGVTNIRLSTTIQKIRNVSLEPGLVIVKHNQRVNIEGLRAWRVLVAFVLTSTYVLLHIYNVEFLWFFPWFLGFAIMGAGVSSMCPMLMFLQWVGFR